MPFAESGEDLMGANGTQLNTLVGHGFEAVFEVCSAIGQGGRRAIGPGGPWERLVEVGVVVFDGGGEVDVAGEVGGFVPIGEETFEDEGSFSDTSGAVEDERLRDAVVLRVVI